MKARASLPPLASLAALTRLVPFAALASLACLAALASASCATAGAPPVVPVEVVALGKLDGSAPVGALPPPPLAGDKNRCDARVTITGRIRTGASCQLDEQISKGQGRMRYPCTGDGPVDIDFGTHRFSGSLLSGRVALDLTTELDWDDNCHWETRQTVTGMLRGSTLRWSYTEKSVRGQGCFAACTASADLHVVTGANPAPDGDDDDDVGGL
jgi:hypothetical protein